MESSRKKSIIEAILFAAGRPIEKKELILSIEISEGEIEKLIHNMQEDYENQNRGIEIIQIEDSYQLITKKELYEYIYPVLDKRNKPKLSNAALETLSIISYNPRITKAEIEAIRGVSSDGCVYKLLEYRLIEEAGKVSELPGKPMSYKTTQEFLRMFGYKSLNDLPELPKYRLDENGQIVIDDLVEEKEKVEGQILGKEHKLEGDIKKDESDEKGQIIEENKRDEKEINNKEN